MNKIKASLLLATIFSLICVGAFVSCSQDPPTESNVTTDTETNYSEYCTFEPFSGNYAQVTFKTSQLIYPATCTIDGKEYTVAVINGFENPNDARVLTGTLEIQAGIMAINSNAFAKAENVSKIILPSSCQSLGSNSLPSHPSEITLCPEAAKDLSKALGDTSSLKTINLVGNGATTITGEFKSLEKVQILAESANVQTYWPALPTFTNTATRQFTGWVDGAANPIVSSSKITNTPTSVSLNGKQYYLYGVATAKFIDEGDEGQGAQGFGINIPYFMVATEDKYSFVFTNYGNGKYGIAPKTTDGVTYELTLNSQKLDDLELDNGQWTINVEQPGDYIFSCLYMANNETVVGYGQVNFSF